MTICPAAILLPRCATPVIEAEMTGLRVITREALAARPHERPASLPHTHTGRTTGISAGSDRCRRRPDEPQGHQRDEALGTHGRALRRGESRAAYQALRPHCESDTESVPTAVGYRAPWSGCGYKRCEHSGQRPWENVAVERSAIYDSTLCHSFFSSRILLQPAQIGNKPASVCTCFSAS
jgi:hypothetical protein